MVRAGGELTRKRDGHLKPDQLHARAVNVHGDILALLVVAARSARDGRALACTAVVSLGHLVFGVCTKAERWGDGEEGERDEEGERFASPDWAWRAWRLRRSGRRSVRLVWSGHVGSMTSVTWNTGAGGMMSIRVGQRGWEKAVRDENASRSLPNISRTPQAPRDPMIVKIHHRVLETLKEDVVTG